MAQETCLNCYRKHVATAMVFEDEATIGNGYPLHKWLAVGELNAAEKEVAKDFPLLSQITRQHRIAYQEEGIPVPTLELIELANQLEDSEEKAKESIPEPINNSEGNGNNSQEAIL